MSNPILNDATLERAGRAGWGAPDPSTRATPIPPITDGPVSAWDPRVMTVAGTASATGVLLVLLLGAAVGGWMAGPDSTGEVRGFPALALVGMLVGFACVIASSFRPMWAKFLAPVYAVAEGFFLGVISKAYETAYHGVVVQALGATVAVFGVMLVLYRSRVIKVTDRFRRIVIGATVGLMVFYLVSLVLHLVTGHGVSFLSSSSGFGIAFSFLAAGLAAFNLALNFDVIERGAARQLPKGMEWFAALGLLVTLVWLYLELLRLFAKLQSRR